MHPTALTQAAQAGRLLTAREVASMLARTVEWFRQHRPDLEAAGFPPRVPRLGNRWDREAIAAWLDEQIPRHQRPPVPGDSDDDPELAQWAALLDGRAAGHHAE